MGGLDARETRFARHIRVGGGTHAEVLDAGIRRGCMGDRGSRRRSRGSRGRSSRNRGHRGGWHRRLCCGWPKRRCKRSCPPCSCNGRCPFCNRNRRILCISHRTAKDVALFCRRGYRRGRGRCRGMGHPLCRHPLGNTKRNRCSIRALACPFSCPFGPLKEGCEHRLVGALLLLAWRSKRFSLLLLAVRPQQRLLLRPLCEQKTLGEPRTDHAPVTLL